MEFSCFLRSVTFVERFSVDFLGEMFACGYSGVRVGGFLKNWHISSHLLL